MIRHFVMEHTMDACSGSAELAWAISKSRESQYILFENDPLDVPPSKPMKNLILSPRKTFEAARQYRDKKVTVLNFGSAVTPGGAPWDSGAQEESLCRASTLYPCLKAKEKQFYRVHEKQQHKGKWTIFGTSDLIYTPNVVVFKSDEEPPKMMKTEDWFRVNVITCAAPIMGDVFNGAAYLKAMNARIDRILAVAEKEGAEALVLGAFGCGVYHNPPALVARVFEEQLKHHYFPLVEFAIYDRHPGPESNLEVFKKVFAEED